MLRWHPLRSTASTARRSHRMPMLVPLLLAVMALAFVTGPGAVPPAGAAKGQATWDSPTSSGCARGRSSTTASR